VGCPLGNPKIRVASQVAESPGSATFYIRVETLRSVFGTTGNPSSGLVSGQNREGAAPDFQVHMPPSGVIAGKFHNAPFRESRWRVAAPNGELLATPPLALGPALHGGGACVAEKVYEIKKSYKK